MNTADFNLGLLQFLNASPTPFHAVREMVGALLEAGFELLHESEAWALQANSSYVFTRNDSSVIAFKTGSNIAEQGWRMVGAHTDSPCLKIKPNPDLSKVSIHQLAVEVYGGVLLSPWFDRDLSIAGRVSIKTQQGKLRNVLVDFKRAIANLPHLAIHLDKKSNDGVAVKRQKELNLVLTSIPLAADEKVSFTELLKNQIEAETNVGVAQILDWELSAYDHQPAAIIGLNDDFITSARLDNLLSCYIGLKSLVSASSDEPCLLVCNDHEEVGSQSASGAQGSMLRDMLQRVTEQLSPEVGFAQVMSKSLMVSADNAHAIHPNYLEKYDLLHAPKINEGPVIKINSNQRYATNSSTSALFQTFCARVNVPVQNFMVNNDMACGSTIGPMTSAELGVATVDVGCPQWAMHSIRETAGSKDPVMLYQSLTEFFNYNEPLVIQV